jgi:hypothetical protein
MRSRHERTKYYFTFSWKTVHCACNERVTVAPAKGVYEAQSPSATEQTIRNTMESRLYSALERVRIDALRWCMSNEHEESRNMTADECDELAALLLEDAAALPPGQKQGEILKLVSGYRDLAKMKRLVLRNVN